MTRDDETECFDPGFLTICHHTLDCPSDRNERERGGCRPQLGSSRRARAVAVSFSLDHHGPDDAGGFGGECHHGDLVGPAREQIAQPWIADAARDLLPQMGAGSADQQRSQHTIPLSGDASRAMLAAGAVVPVSPIQAAKSRPERNTFASGTLANTVVAIMGPT